MPDLCPACGAYWECGCARAVSSAIIASDGQSTVVYDGETVTRITAADIDAALVDPRLLVEHLEAVRDEYRDRYSST